MPFTKNGVKAHMLLLLGAVLLIPYSTTAASVKIGIVGAGIAGTTAAHFLRQTLRNTSTIDIFERDHVGGRTQTFNADGKVIEMGASIVFQQNNYFRDLADEMGLKRVEPGSTSDSPFSIFDGQEFVFNQSSWSVMTLFRLVRRYGLSYFRFQSAPKSLLRRFLQIYHLQSEGRAFATPEELLQEIQLYDLTQHDMRSEIQNVLGSGIVATRFSTEIVAAINRINYNQDNSLNAMAGMVSMLPTVDDRVFALEGGNYRLAVELLRQSNARLSQPAEVESVEKAANGSFFLHLQDRRAGPYHAVIIAAPLEQSTIRFKGISQPVIPPRKFQTTVTTIVRASGLQASFFNVAEVPNGEYIMVAESWADAPFSVIAPITDLQGGTRLFKVFSAAVLPNDTVAQIFRNHSIVASHSWKAYPRFNPPEQFARFELAEGLYYINAWENAASCMEVSAIGAKNAALLVAQYLTTRTAKQRNTSRDTVEL